VVRAALLLLDEVGLDDLTMRRLAERLGVKAASLYRHVRDKQELLVLLADEICAGVPTALPEGPWREQFATLMRSYRASCSPGTTRPGSWRAPRRSARTGCASWRRPFASCGRED
jgi:AcrR family transcriptional regulator